MAERKRPWYLLVSLLAALAFGANGARSGWGTVMLYREPIDASVAGQGVADEADRAAIVARVEGYVRALDAAKARGWPLGVATLLLGASTFLFAMRAIGRRSGARVALVQLVIAQAGANVASYFLLRDVLEAHLRVFEATEAADFHEHVSDKSHADEMSRSAVGALRAATPIALGIQLLGSALVVVALTRRRSRDFFDAPAPALGEQ